MWVMHMMRAPSLNSLPLDSTGAVVSHGTGTGMVHCRESPQVSPYEACSAKSNRAAQAGRDAKSADALALDVEP